MPSNVAPGGRYCPGCGVVYHADYADAFCVCGTELVGAPLAAPAGQPPPEATLIPSLEKPPPGTTCLVLYNADRQAVHYFTLEKDVTLIGRLDAAGGNFPDIDLNAGTGRHEGAIALERMEYATSHSAAADHTEV